MDISRISGSEYWSYGFFIGLESLLELECKRLRDEGKSMKEIHSIVSQKYANISPAIDAILYELLAVEDKAKSAENNVYANNFLLGYAEALRVIMQREKETAFKERKEDVDAYKTCVSIDQFLREKYSGVEMVNEILGIMSVLPADFTKIWEYPKDKITDKKVENGNLSCTNSLDNGNNSCNGYVYD